jgi:hypothetical protein
MYFEVLDYTNLSLDIIVFPHMNVHESILIVVMLQRLHPDIGISERLTFNLVKTETLR